MDHQIAMPVQYELRRLFHLMNIQFTNASKFNPKSAVFRCIFQQLITLLKRKIFKKIFFLWATANVSVCVSQNFISMLLFCQRICWLKIKNKQILSITLIIVYTHGLTDLCTYALRIMGSYYFLATFTILQVHHR